MDYKIKKEGGVIEGILPYPPSVNRYWRNFRGRMVLSADGRAYKKCASIAASLGGQKFAPMNGQVQLSVWINRPKRIGDLDNSLKAIMDSLSGVAYVDDSQVSVIWAKRFDDKSMPPCVCFEVFECDDSPSFLVYDIMSFGLK